MSVTFNCGIPAWFVVLEFQSTSFIPRPHLGGWREMTSPHCTRVKAFR